MQDSISPPRHGPAGFARLPVLRLVFLLLHARFIITRCTPTTAFLLTCPQVTNDTITLKGGEEIKYGVCVWSAGNAPRPLVQQLAEQIPEQAQYQPGGRPSKLAVDPFLRWGLAG